MTPSLEHICRVLCRSTLNDQSRSDAANTHYVEKHWGDFELQARRFLAALAEPHPDMIEAMERACFKHAPSSSPWTLSCALKGWQAAVKEPLG